MTTNTDNTNPPSLQISAPTMVELKAKLRKQMGWPDRRSWSAEERVEVASLFNLRHDYKMNRFVATPKSTTPTNGDQRHD